MARLLNWFCRCILRYEDVADHSMGMGMKTKCKWDLSGSKGGYEVSRYRKRFVRMLLEQMISDYLSLAHQSLLVVEFALKVTEKISEMEITHMNFMLVSRLFRDSKEKSFLPVVNQLARLKPEAD